MVKHNLIDQQLTGEAITAMKGCAWGSTGSRLLSGNYALMEAVEARIASFHDAAAGLLFNSGYDANTGLLGCVPRQQDTIVYDALSHASIRDGIRLSRAQARSFVHNSLTDLQEKLDTASGNIFVVTESVFSMDGDTAPLQQMAALCRQYQAHLMVDEAHATGVIGHKGEGLVQLLGLQQQCLARVHTFGKACGAHGAIVLGSRLLRDYLINFARPFIFTTSLPQASIAAIDASYTLFPALAAEREQLNWLTGQFQQSHIKYPKLRSLTPVQGVIIPGNEAVKAVAQQLQHNGLDVRPILYPSVPKGSERLRIVMHAFNTEEEVGRLVGCLQ